MAYSTEQEIIDQLRTMYRFGRSPRYPRLNQFPQITPIDRRSQAFDCWGYVISFFGLPLVGDSYDLLYSLLDLPENTNPQPGNVIFYLDEDPGSVPCCHVGIIYYLENMVLSKWNRGPVYIHPEKEIPWWYKKTKKVAFPLQDKI